MLPESQWKFQCRFLLHCRGFLYILFYVINTFAKYIQSLADLFDSNKIPPETRQFILGRIPIPKKGNEDGFDISFKMAEDLVELRKEFIRLFFAESNTTAEEFMSITPVDKF